MFRDCLFFRVWRQNRNEPAAPLLCALRYARRIPGAAEIEEAPSERSNRMS